VYVADNNNQRIQKFDSSGAFLTKWGTPGSGDGQFNTPLGVAVDPAGNVYVAEQGNNRIQKFDSSGTFLLKWGTPGSGDGQFSIARDVAVDSAGDVYVVDQNNQRIQKFDSSGAFLTEFGSGGSGDGQFNNPIGVEPDSAGNVYVADFSNNRIQKFDSSGAFLTEFGSGGSGDGQFNGPISVDVNSAGDVYVADLSNNRIQVFEQLASAFSLNSTVIIPNIPPVANDDSFTTPFATPLVDLDVLANDTDAESDPLIITNVTTPTDGTAIINVTSTGINYTSDLGFSGVDSFNYTISDGSGGIDTATVTITVNATSGSVESATGNGTIETSTSSGEFSNLEPITEESLPTEGKPPNVAFPFGFISFNVTDLTPGETVTITLTYSSNIPSPAEYWKVIDGNWTEVTSLLGDDDGDNILTLTLTDGGLGDADGIVNGEILDPGGVGDSNNTAPVANDDFVTTPEDTALLDIDVLTNDTDGESDPLIITNVTTPQNGTAVINVTLTGISYTPEGNFNGIDSFSYTITDGEFNSTATVTVTITSVNDAPVALDDFYTVPEDTAGGLVIAGPGVLLNDTDADLDSLSAFNVTDVTNGTLTLNIDGSFIYQSDPNFNGIDTFQYVAFDGTNSSNIANVTITVTPVNDPPVAVIDSYTTPEDTLLVSPVSLLANDTDIDLDSLSAGLETDATNGNVTVFSNGTFTYDPDPNFNGIDTFNYNVTDGIATDATTVFITVTAVNDVPIAFDDEYTTPEDTQLIVTGLGVLLNDTDADLDSLSAFNVTDVSNGTLSFTSGGSFTYDPEPGFFGIDTFQYEVFDGDVAEGLSFASSTFFGGAGDQLGRDIDVGSDLYVVGTEGAQGVLVKYSNPPTTPVWDRNLAGNTFLFGVATSPSNVYAVGAALPGTGTCGASDGAGGTEHKSAFAQYDTDGNLLSCTSPNYFNYRGSEHYNDVTYSGDFAYATGAAQVCGSNGLFTIGKYNGTTGTLVDSTNDQLLNGFGCQSGGATFGNSITSLNGDIFVVGGTSFNVAGDDHRPVVWKFNTAGLVQQFRVQDDTVGAFLHGAVGFENNLYAVGQTFVPANPTDRDYIIQKYNATTGAVIWTTIFGGPGLDVLRDITESDGHLFAIGHTENDSAGGKDIITMEIDPATGDVISSELFGGSLFGIGETRSFTEGGNGAGQADFVILEYNAVTASSDIANVTITVTSVNDAPVALDDTYTTLEDTFLVSSVSVLANDTDADNDPLTAVLVTDVFNGTLILDSNGTFTYDPDPDFFGIDGFEYNATDGTDADTALVIINVISVNDIPVALNDTYTTPEDTVLNIDPTLGVLANDTDADLDVLTAVLITNVTNGTLSLFDTGSFQYTPDPNFNGIDTFQYEAFDGTNSSDIANVTITVTSVSDAPVALNDTYTTPEDTFLVSSVSVLANDTDADNDPLTAVLVFGGFNGTLILDSNGTFTYDPDPDFFGIKD